MNTTRKILLLLLWLAVVGFLLTAEAVLVFGQEPIAPPIISRKYHRATIADITAGKVHHTHLEVQGWVTYVKREEDGDLHIRICNSPKIKLMDRANCLVLECIPRMPCPAPDLGKEIAAHGIKRFDDENWHKFYEIHPVEEGFW